MKEKILKATEIIISQTNLKGEIIYANKVFYKISEYSDNSLLGKNHNILRHEDMPKVIFKLLWEKLNKKKYSYLFIKNKTKNGDYYWLFSYIYPSLNRDKTIRNYISISYPISQKAKKIVENLYKELLSIEKENGLSSSINFFKKFIDTNKYKKEQTDNNIIYNIQY